MTDPRTEAERLVATLLGGASVAAESLKGFATGSAECCVCPVCKAIAAAREPNPDLAGRLADGAGEIAVGVANMLRAFAGAGQPTPPPAERTAPAGGDVWAAATRAQDSARSTEETPGRAEPAAPPTPPRPMAKKATKPKAAPPAEGDE